MSSKCYDKKVSLWLNNLPESVIELKMPRKNANKQKFQLDSVPKFTLTARSNCANVVVHELHVREDTFKGHLVSMATLLLMPSCLGALFGVFSGLLGQYISGTYARRKVAWIT